MITIPYEKTVALICEKSKREQSEVEEMIAKKLQEFSGLISQEGAAHVVANDLGISLVELASVPLKLAEIKAGTKDVQTLAKVTRIFEKRTFERNGGMGQVQSVLLADETATMRLTFWHDDTAKVSDLHEGDIVNLSHITARENQGRVELTFSVGGVLQVNPHGVEISAVEQQMDYVSSPLDAVRVGQRLVVTGYIVQAFRPNFYMVDRVTGKKVTGDYNSEKHDYAYVCNVVIDDGSETLRCVLFRQLCTTLLGLTHEGVLEIKDNPDLFETHHVKLLGNKVTIRGRVVENSFSDRNELMVDSIDF